MNLTDTFDSPDLLRELKDYGFDLEKDLKRTGLGQSGYNQILQDVADDLENDRSGSRLIQSEKYSDLAVYKMRCKDPKRNSGKRGGYRIILVAALCETSFICHIYHKHAGKKPKTDLTSNEKNQLRKLVSNLEKVREASEKE
ncbi:hypothetical protein [Faecalibaculum rodentium]|uniref:Addiction module toxin RelE n=2 Tax=Faecalibaculum rodentium TaxID=1702221 RepID=A0A140DXR0_9FIRM|nr:hypothetical protein [Faecalibaculum rodentium]AMK55437.1 hypothetical protein AALO17_23030 [Faecalibaculum rodentium]